MCPHVISTECFLDTSSYLVRPEWSLHPFRTFWMFSLVQGLWLSFPALCHPQISLASFLYLQLIIKRYPIQSSDQSSQHGAKTLPPGSPQSVCQSALLENHHCLFGVPLEELGHSPCFLVLSLRRWKSSLDCFPRHPCGSLPHCPQLHFQSSCPYTTPCSSPPSYFSVCCFTVFVTIRHNIFY